MVIIIFIHLCEFSGRIIPFLIPLPNMVGNGMFSVCNWRFYIACYKIYRNFVTSICVFRLFLNRKVFLLWPIERCKRGLSVCNSPELSSVGLLGLSWLVTVSPGETVDHVDHVASTVFYRGFYSTVQSTHAPLSKYTRLGITPQGYSRSTQQVFYTRVLCLMEHGTTSSKHKLLLKKRKYKYTLCVLFFKTFGHVSFSQFHTNGNKNATYVSLLGQPKNFQI